jgi:hypothetical protein
MCLPILVQRTLRCRTASATQRAGTLRYVAASSIVMSGRWGSGTGRSKDAERRAGEALRALSEDEGLSVRETVECCGTGITVREVTRLRPGATRRTADEPAPAQCGRSPPAESPAASATSPTTDSDAYSPPAATGRTGSNRPTMMPNCEEPFKKPANNCRPLGSGNGHLSRGLNAVDEMVDRRVTRLLLSVVSELPVFCQGPRCLLSSSRDFTVVLL